MLLHIEGVLDPTAVVRLRAKLESKRARQNLLDDEGVRRLQMKEEEKAHLLRR